MKSWLIIFSLLAGLNAYSADDDMSELETQEPEKPATTTPQPEQKTASSKKANPSVLDFEAELIEGERKAPDLFFQLQPGTPNLDAILFQRTNFNDFHDLEKRRRPLYRRYPIK